MVAYYQSLKYGCLLSISKVWLLIITTKVLCQTRLVLVHFLIICFAACLQVRNEMICFAAYLQVRNEMICFAAWFYLGFWWIYFICSQPILHLENRLYNLNHNIPWFLDDLFWRWRIGWEQTKQIIQKPRHVVVQIL